MMSRNTVAVAWALHARGISATAWKILMVLAHRVNNRRGDWDVWPKQQTLADDCDMPLSTLKRHLDELEEKGFIKREKRMKRSGGFSGCTYTLAVEASFRMPGAIFDHDFLHDDPDEDDGETLAQYELARSPRDELARSLTGELAIEPLNPEPLNKRTPSPNGEAPREENGLFGNAELPEGDPQKLMVDHVVARWNELAAQVPAISKVVSVSETRRRAIAKRTDDLISSKGMIFHNSSEEAWDEFLTRIGRSPFLTGAAPPGRERDTPFVIDFDFMLKSANFIKILEGKYDDKREHSRHFASDGRKKSPHELAADNIKQSIRDALAKRQGDGRGRDRAGTPAHPLISGPRGD